MNVRTLFSVHSIIALVFGLGLLLAPSQVLSLYGGELADAGVVIGRLYGSALLTFAAVLWLARDSQPSAARRAILQGFFVTLIVGALAALHGQLTSQTINALGWTTVLIYAGLAGCYGYLVLRQGGASET